ATSSISTLSLHDALPIYRRSIRRNAVAMEGRLHQPSLLQVQCAFAREQAVSQEPLCAVETTAFHEARVVGDEHVFDDLRVADERSEEHTSELQSRENLVC